MRKPFIITVIVSALCATLGCTMQATEPEEGSPDPAHNARNSLDWAGSYRGVLPCADCEGIETLVVLRDDGSYRRQSRYLGEDDATFSEEGQFSWNEAGNTVSLAGAQPGLYFVAENRLVQLRLDGSSITGVLAQHYVLTKLSTSLTGTRWKLVELNGQALPELPREPYLLLDAETGQVSGFGACNGFQGAYRLDEANLRISFGDLASTLMACSAGMEIEHAFHEVLRSVDNYSFNGSQLTLNRARMAPLARFEAVHD